MPEESLNTFYQQLESDVTSESNPRAGSLANFREGAFTQIICDDLEQAGVLESPIVCHHEWGSGNAAIKASGYGIPDEDSRLDLVVTEYRYSPDIPPSINSAEIKRAFRRGARYLERAWDGLQKAGRVAVE